MSSRFEAALTRGTHEFQTLAPGPLADTGNSNIEMTSSVNPTSRQLLDSIQVASWRTRIDVFVSQISSSSGIPLPIDIDYYD